MCDRNLGHGLDLIDVAKQAAVDTTIWAIAWTNFRSAKTRLFIFQHLVWLGYKRQQDSATWTFCARYNKAIVSDNIPYRHSRKINTLNVKRLKSDKSKTNLNDFSAKSFKIGNRR